MSTSLRARKPKNHLLRATIVMNNSERFVYGICKRSFLSIWSYANPLGKKGRELCDILVVCDPDVIIFSVKDIAVTESNDPGVDWLRWWKKAIRASAKQIYGAERWIRKAPYVIRSDGNAGCPFPEKSTLRIHRVAVALGGQASVPLFFGDFGRGFVHVLDEDSFNTVLKELDTISDFVEYIVEKEAFCSSVREIITGDSEKDWLGLYLYNQRKFPRDYDVLRIDGGLWDKLTSRPEYQRKKQIDRDSYFWDGLIETFCEDVLQGNLELSSSPTGAERALRVMARENRFARRLLGRSFQEFLFRSDKIRSRMVLSPSQITYVFLARPHGDDRRSRIAELADRCFVALGISRENNVPTNTVLGIATEQYVEGKGCSLDLLCLVMEGWTKEDEKKLQYLRQQGGLFSDSSVEYHHEDEYPAC